MKKSMINIIMYVFVILYSSITNADFGALQIVNDVKAGSVLVGKGHTYVTFLNGVLNGCSSSQGGYITASWPDAKLKGSEIKGVRAL